VFVVNHRLTIEKLEHFARHGLQDTIVQDAFVNSAYRNDLLRSYLLIARLPGVTDDEGVSAEKTLCDLMGWEYDPSRQQIFSQDIYYFENELSDSELKRLGEDLLGNVLVNHFQYGASDERKIYLPEVKIAADDTTNAIDIFIPDEDLVRLSKEMVLSLSLDELRAIQDYFSSPAVSTERKKRGLPDKPTDCELEVLAQTWSEHCKHKEFNALIEYTDLESGETETIDSLFRTFIKGSTDVISERLNRSGDNWLVKVFSDNAGVVRIDEDRVFVWKVETHNTPSALDPYGGAITGILGNNRDPLGTGRGGGKLLFNTNVLCFGRPDYDKPLLTGQLHPERVFAGVRHGIEDGGNKSGIPTVNGAIIFDDRYSGKPLVYCGTGSVMPSTYAGRESWVKEISDGDRIVMAGGRVGKDGIHGATFSSAEIDNYSPRSAVQIGSPITQKLLSDFLERACEEGLVKCCTDCGAGGLSSSVGELARISGGARVHLERVPLKYAGLKPWEIFVSESQERMTLVVEDEHLAELCRMAEEFEVEVSDLGCFTADGYLDVRFEGKPVASIDLDFLHNGVPQKTLQAEWAMPACQEPPLPEIDDYNDIVLRLMGSLNICSREDVIRQYDHEVKGKTVVKPLMGARGKASQDAAVMRLGFDSYEGIAISNGIIPRYGDIDAYEMSAGAFDEAIRQIISVGGKLPDVSSAGNGFWSVNDNFCVPDSAYDERDNPDGKYKLAQLVRMCRALYDMAVFFDIPMTSGKDSMKNDFKADGEKISIPPTILYSMVAKIADVRRTLTSEFKSSGAAIYLIGRTYNELGGSEFYSLFGELGANVPRVRKEDAKRIYQKMMRANDLDLIESSHDLSDGGLAVAVAECAIGSGLGADLSIETGGKSSSGAQDDSKADRESGRDSSSLSTNAVLFSESHSRFVVSVSSENKDRFEEVMGSECSLIGEVSEQDRFRVSIDGLEVIDLALSEIESVWARGLEIHHGRR
jgi:phosphoribosylformylglycinamidine synthase